MCPYINLTLQGVCVCVCVCFSCLLSVKLSDGLMRVSRVRGVPWQSGAGKPGIKQANMQSCSRDALFCKACIHSKNRRTPSRRIYSVEERETEMRHKEKPKEVHTSNLVIRIKTVRVSLF